jgi:primosomal protein N' (replication factor Y) (superfamily II helicase)
VRFASVVLTEPALSHLDRKFTYRVPDEMTVQPGSVVRVPFRRKNREGVVVELLSEPDVAKTLPIKDVLGPGLDPGVLELCSHLAENYLSTLGEALAAAVPERVADEEKQQRGKAPRVQPRSLTWLAKYRNGAALQRALGASRYAGFSWRPGRDRAGQITSMVAAVAARGRGALVLVPEVRVGGETVAALESLGDAVAWLGSDRSARERYREWLALRSGEKLVAVGGRGAIYAPVRDLGFVVGDDESHVSYKERRAPRIQARGAAAERARRAGAVLVAVGIPPSIEAGAAVERGVLQPVTLPRAEVVRSRPPVTVVDLGKDASRLVPSAETLRRSKEELDRGRRVVLLIHRAGDEARRAAARTIRILQPRRPARLDARADPDVLADAIRDADCIVATPVIAKDLAIERVGLIAILEADAALSVPEFRGAEEAFATWWHVAPWAAAGRVVIETAQPSHPAIRALVRWDPDSLYRWDASRRRETGYPPFAGLARIDLPPANAEETAATIRRAMPGATVLGPSVRNSKAVLAVRCATRAELIEGLRPLSDAWREKGEPIRVDVDPREVLP